MEYPRPEQQPAVAACPRHPDRPAWVGCQRCGRPICGECMIPAAVGHQCPECVAADSQQVRRPNFGRSGWAAAPVTLGLIGLNIAVWLAIVITGGSSSPLVDPLALNTTARCWMGDATYVDVTAQACVASGGSFVPGVVDGGYWQLLTSMFTHVQPTHILLNLMTLWFLGRPLEGYFGRVQYLALYLVAGLAGSVAVYWLADPDASTVGASGAIFGLMGALLIIAWRNRGNVQDILFWLALNVAFTFLGPGISWQGHLGGLVGGCVATLALLLPKQRRAPALIAMVVVLLALTAGRTLTLV